MMVAIPVNVGNVAIQSALQWSFVFLLLVNLRKTTGMNYLEDSELAFPEIKPFCHDSSTPFGVTPHHVNTINAHIFHTQFDKFIRSVPRWGMTIRQIKHIHHHPSPQKYPQGGGLDVGSSNGGSWRLIRPQTFLKSPDGLTSTTRALGAPVFFPWRAFAFSALAGETATRLKSAMHWTLTDCFSCWSYCLDWGWCQLHNLDHIFVMQNMVFATHLSQGDVKQWNCSSHNCYHCSMWFVFLTRHLELQPSIPSSWLKWQPTSTYHLSVNPGLVWDYDKEHEFCGLCPSHSKTKWSTIPVDACWLILDQPDCNTLQQPGLGRLLHAAAPHKGVLEVFQQGFWVNMRYFESGGTGRNNSHAQIDDNWIQDSV